MDRLTKKRALVTGVSGQDGSYLAELLIEKGYEVHGIRRRSSLFNSARIDHMFEEAQSPARRLSLHYADLSDSSSLYKLVDKIKPDEIYNLGAQSHVGVSFDVPEYTADVVALGTIRLLEAMRQCCPDCRFYQASSSEMFGKAQEIPQKETTPFYPRSPYGAAKVFAYWVTKNYRESYNLFAANGILFNHESPRRGRNFVTRKVTRAIANILQGKQDIVYLGNLDASRDWGHAKDYVRAMWQILQHTTADDFVVSTGETHTVREFVECAFRHVDIEIVWEGHGLEETGKDPKTGRVYVKIDPRYMRPAEVPYLLGDSSKAREVLKWSPSYSFKDLVTEMLEFDLANESKEGGYLAY